MESFEYKSNNDEKEYLNERTRMGHTQRNFFGKFVVENLNLHMMFENDMNAPSERGSTADWRKDMSYTADRPIDKNIDLLPHKFSFSN